MPRLTCLMLLGVFSLPADVSTCACDPARPETMQARECGLCREADKAAGDVFFLKDINPRKPNRWLALPKTHGTAGHSLAGLTLDERTRLWTAAIDKAKEMWGGEWGLAYNGEKVRTQCHTHIHMGHLIQGVETARFTVVKGPEDIPAPKGDGFWVHPAGNALHVHTGEQIAETVLLR